MDIVELEFDGRDQRVLRFEHAQSGARGYVIVDSTVLGPAMGGCRLWHYPDDDTALRDAQRLARGMSLKNAMAGLPLGGGKAVLQLPHGPFDREAMFSAFGEAVNKFAGDYLTAEDVGTTEEDMRCVREISPFVFGLPTAKGKAGGNPSPWTALGVFRAMSALLARSGRDFSGVTVAVQGLGQVGIALCDLLHDAGASLIVADVNRARLALAVSRGWTVSSVEEIHRAPADIFAPCALGAILSAETIPQLTASMIVGAANNQLAASDDAERLLTRGILYAPDYIVNAGGIINVAAEYFGDDASEVSLRVDGIADRIVAIVEQAASEGVSPAVIADRLAEARVSSGAKLPTAKLSRAS